MVNPLFVKLFSDTFGRLEILKQLSIRNETVKI